jgi:3-dehydroquinate synthetase
LSLDCPSVGETKAGINHPLGKQRAFHQPQAVLIDTTQRFTALPLVSFPQAWRRLSEYGLICVEPFLDWRRYAGVRALDQEALTTAITHSLCESVLSPRMSEIQVQATLNLGAPATGHAIETQVMVSENCVVRRWHSGTVMAFDMSERLGGLLRLSTSELLGCLLLRKRLFL